VTLVLLLVALITALSVMYFGWMGLLAVIGAAVVGQLIVDRPRE